MKVHFFSVLVFFGLCIPACSQGYVSYLTGDPFDVESEVLSGSVLMGGASESDAAMQWFLQRAGGGDVVVIRSSGADGYNDYLYTELGVQVNSVETIVIASDEAAMDPYVIQQIMNAEALWIAGGDQYNYVNYWKDSPVHDALNYLINDKGITIGGTSAGMAILGQAYFDAQNGTVSSATALNDPFSSAVSLGYDDFLHIPFLESVITDTHYDNPVRKGRHVAFMARLMTGYFFRPLGIASEEYTAVCIDEHGLARVFGNYPSEDDFAWFIQPDCPEPAGPELCAAGQPLTWSRGGHALKACKVPGTVEGIYSFSLSDWNTTSGGVWEDWYVEDGTLSFTSDALPFDCEGLSAGSGMEDEVLRIYPNPVSGDLVNFSHAVSGDLYNTAGRLLFQVDHAPVMDLAGLETGVYFFTTRAGVFRIIR